MQIRHVKNLCWLIFVIALIVAIVFRSSPFLLWRGLTAALLALISIFARKPNLLWLSLFLFFPLVWPFLLLAEIAFMFGKKIRKYVYWGGAPAVAIAELICIAKFWISELNWLGCVGLIAWFLYILFFASPVGIAFALLTESSDSPPDTNNR